MWGAPFCDQVVLCGEHHSVIRWSYVGSTILWVDGPLVLCGEHHSVGRWSCVGSTILWAGGPVWGVSFYGQVVLYGEHHSVIRWSCVRSTILWADGALVLCGEHHSLADVHRAPGQSAGPAGSILVRYS